MYLKGIIDISTLWRDHASMVIFFNGCPLKCRGCQNYSDEHFQITIDEVKEKIYQNKFIDSIVVSGGEPLEQCYNVMEILKFAKGNKLKTAIETSGYYPLRLQNLINNKLLDKVFLDIKGNSYHTGKRDSWIKSYNCIERTKGIIDLELRTTLFRTFPDISMIIRSLYPYQLDVLQQGCPENTINISNDEKLSRDELLAIAKKYHIKTIRTKERGEESGY